MRLLLAMLLLVAFTINAAEDAPPKPVLKITPGKVIVPTDKMRRIWGELVSLDAATRTGTFRNESNDAVMPFTIMPYAELLHHAAFGDVQDFRIGERAIFRLHENEAGEWVWLTYIQDEMNFLNGHKEYYHVDAIDAEKQTFTATDGSADKSYIREKNLLFQTDKETRYWKNGEPASFADVKVGDKVRTKTHGVGKGKVRVCWEIFLDDASFLKFQTEQKAVHSKRMTEDGIPGYVDSNADKTVAVTFFQEGGEIARKLKAGVKVKIALAGKDRKPTAEPVAATVKESKMAGNLGKATIILETENTTLGVGEVVRVWVVQ